jgi:hypothetical protein
MTMASDIDQSVEARQRLAGAAGAAVLGAGAPVPMLTINTAIRTITVMVTSMSTIASRVTTMINMAGPSRTSSN